MQRTLAALSLILSITISATAADWPHWRGPNRTDIVAENSGWDNKAWPPQEIAWRGQFGAGSSAPLVVAGKLYAIGWEMERDVLRCVDAVTGRELWKVDYPCPQYAKLATGDQGQYSGTSATPEFDTATGFLYSMSIDGDVHCWDTNANGRKVWGLNLRERYNIIRRPEVSERGQTLRDYGYTTAPLVWGDWLIVEAGARAGTLIAFDKRTGAQAWTSECTDEAGHSGGLVPITVEGVPCLAVLTLRNLLVVRLDAGQEGKTVATYKWTTDYGNNIATPAVHKNYVVITSAYNHAAMCKLEITLKGANKLWETERIASGVCSPIIHKGHVYWAWRNVHCVDFETGQLKWAGSRLGTQGSCILTADDRLIVWCNRGDLLLVETAERSPDRYTELASRTKLFPRDAWPHVVLADGRLYCKDRSGEIICFVIK